MATVPNCVHHRRGSVVPALVLIAASAGASACDRTPPKYDREGLPPCEVIEHELEPALLDDPVQNQVGWAGFVRERLDELEHGGVSELRWLGHSSPDVLRVSPDEGTTISRIHGRLVDGPIRYEELDQRPGECTSPPGSAYLPLEVSVKTDDGALDEVWRLEGLASPSGGAPTVGQAPPPGAVEFGFRGLQGAFAGSLDVELTPEAGDEWGDGVFGAMIHTAADPEAVTVMEGGMIFSTHREEGEGEGLIIVAHVAQW